MNNRKSFIPIPALLGALLLALVATMTPFVADPDRAYAQQSANADLTSLAVVGAPGGGVHTGGELAPSFAPATTEYTVRTIYNDTGVTVTAEAADAGATVRVNGQTTNDSNQVGLSIPDGQTTNISVVVTAAAGNTKTYMVKAYRNRQNLSDNANLSSLSISPSGGLKESATSTSAAPIYEARVQSGMVTVDYTLSDRAGGASAVVTAGTATIADEAKPKELTLTGEGATSNFTVVVTAEDASTKTYTINVYRIRANPSIDATLRALTANDQGGTDTVPSFAAATTMYDYTVANTVEYVTVAPTAMDAGAHYVISPSDARPDTGHQVNLTAGVDTTITVVVTAEDNDATETYTLMIYKRRADGATNPAIDDATLSALGLSVGTLDPAFASATRTYSVQVAADVEKVTVSYTPTNNLGGATVAVAASGGSTITASADDDEVTLAEAGATTAITVTVTAEDGSTTTTPVYTINVYRLRALPSADASLASLTVTGAAALTLAPAFTANTLSAEAHKATAPFSDTNVTVAAAATAAANGATVEIIPADSDTNTDGHQVALAAGAETRITVTVTAEDRATAGTYTVVVYRQRTTLETDATLSALSLSDGMLSPAFASDRMEYDARVGTDVGEVTVSYAETDDKGGVSVGVTNGTTNAATAGSACPTTGVGDKVALGGAGTETLIHVCVTPESGAAGTKVYAITVYRERANRNDDATLMAFAISDVNPAAGISPAPVDGVALACGPNDTRVACDLKMDSMPIVDYRVRTVSITATATDGLGASVEIVSPADKNPATARHDIDLAAGQITNIEVLVTAEDTSVTKTYTAGVYRKSLTPSDDATLSGLMLTGAQLVEDFASDTMEYTANAAFSTTQVTVSATTTDTAGGARVAYGTATDATPPVFTAGTDADRDMDGHQVMLGAAGSDTEIVVQGTAEDGSTELYTITISRADTAGTDASLTSLSLTDSNGMDVALTAGVAAHWDTLDCPMMNDRAAMHADVDRADLMDDMSSPYCAMYAGLSDDAKAIVREVYEGDPIMGFMPGVNMYYAMVGSDVDSVDVSAMAMVGSMITGDTGMQAVMVGETTIEIMVTAEDGETMMTYTVMVTREAMDDEARLLGDYDADNDGVIDASELNNAIGDYLDGTLSASDMNILIGIYLQG
ncbi:MAG: cadherin-like beta sandwich domain-containing protein [Chloroflexota bacterium]|nr:cadherin-like beta sandwich domain-containing protein [Chloroflexota bacterium]